MVSPPILLGAPEVRVSPTIMPAAADGAISGVRPRRSRPRCRTPGVCPARRSGSAVVPGSWRRPPWLAGFAPGPGQLSRSGRKAPGRMRGRQLTRASWHVRKRLRLLGAAVDEGSLGLVSRRCSRLIPSGVYKRQETVAQPPWPGLSPTADGRAGSPGGHRGSRAPAAARSPCYGWWPGRPRPTLGR